MLTTCIRPLLSQARRNISSSASCCSGKTPWFVDREVGSHSNIRRLIPPHMPDLHPPLPQNVPETLRLLHAELKRSPHLEPSSLLVSEPLHVPPGPPLPLKLASGKRKRGGTDSGKGAIDMPGGIWSWTVMAHVKEGTEDRGAIESVVRLVRKTLLAIEPPIHVPRNSKSRMENGWALIDLGDHAIHIMSKDAMTRYFSEGTLRSW